MSPRSTQEAEPAPRYAVYAVPGMGGDPVAEQLRELATAWLEDPRNAGITRDPRRYGYPATLKAPFRLVDGPTEDDLIAAVEAYASRRDPVVLPHLALNRIGDFSALVPDPQTEQIGALAAAMAMSLDGFRAAPTDAEIARRRPDRMTPRQRELFAMWGYPYVLDEFRFHITLTDPIQMYDYQRDQIGTALLDAFEPVLGRDVPIEAVAVCIEPQPGAAFEILSVHPLMGATEAAK